ncbi:MAG: hypothetical protein IT365_02660 [Candidatus Hydrogenedentes bacterium]|nr:hypothetical protein [Candidatus Hydrogenedentota bacterium]
MGGTTDIGARITDYFERQIALYTEMLHAYETLPAELEKENLEILSAQQSAFTQRLTQLDEEFHLLNREWRNGAAASPQRAHQVRALADQARDLAKQLEKISRKASQQARERMGEVKLALDALRRGQRAVKQYRVDEDGAGHVDRKA